MNKIKVLYIEDNPGDIRLIKEMLSEIKGLPFDLEYALDLSTGLERLAAAKEGIDVVLLDLGLPDSKGLESLNKLIAQAPGLAIIVLTGLADDILGVKSVQAGAQDYLVKGMVDSNLLSRTLRHSIERKQMSEALRKIILNMSHDLRTPLNAIIGFSDLLYSEYNGSLNKSQKRYASNILKNGKHLFNIINNILTTSTIENGKMELLINEFLVSDAIEEVEVLMIPIASEKDIDLTCNIDIGMLTIKADMIKFKQILYNLVNNAIKFTDQGGSVTIGGKISDDFVHIFVKDEGIGISPDDQDKLFTPFFQADSPTARNYEGAGLGLSIVKKFVEMHGGKVWVESEPGHGSTFTFSIPIGSNVQ